MTEDYSETSFIGGVLIYLNHKLILSNNKNYEGVYVYVCEKCNIFANCYCYKDIHYYHYHYLTTHWELLYLTCDEMIIKRLLE